MVLYIKNIEWNSKLTHGEKSLQVVNIECIKNKHARHIKLNFTSTYLKNQKYKIKRQTKSSLRIHKHLINLS